MKAYSAAAPPLGVLLVFAHGAGAGENHPFMTGYARALAARGVDVVTFEFPYMAQKRRAPDRPPVLEQAFRDAVAAAREGRESHRVFVGGKSMGGRMATHLATEPGLGLSGVVSLGYPLHPPGKAEQKRTAHFPRIGVPWLIVQGERDAFGTVAELEPELAAVTSPVQLHVVAGGDHSLVVKGRATEDVRADVVAAIVNWLARATGDSPGTP
jgi:predicted alpha/beta-hydrolase family hydrolase